MDSGHLSKIADKVHETAVEKGWWPTGGRHLGEILMNIVGEAAELWESYRDNTLGHASSKEIEVADDGRLLTNEEEEVADILIRTLDYAAHRGLDVDEIVEAKMHYNKKRPYRHGWKRS